MKFLIMFLLVVGLTACSNSESEEKEMSIDSLNQTELNEGNGTTTTTTTTTETSVNTGGNEASERTSNINNKAEREVSNVNNANTGVSKTGQYNSNQGTPPPPNVDAQRKAPAHTYGDTASRRDGANSVR